MPEAKEDCKVIEEVEPEVEIEETEMPQKSKSEEKSDVEN